MSQRTLILVLSMVVAYFCIWAGDGSRMAYDPAVKEATTLFHDNYVGGVVFCIAFLGLCGIVLLGAFLGFLLQDDTLHITFAAWQLLAWSVVLGLGAAPITRFGPYPWDWATSWNLVLVGGLFPMVLIVRETIVQLYASKQTPNNVEHLRKVA